MTNHERVETIINTIEALPMGSGEKTYAMYCVAKANTHGDYIAYKAVRREILTAMREQNKPMRVKELQQYFPFFSVQCLTQLLKDMVNYGMVQRTEKATGRILVVSYEGWDDGVCGYVNKTKEIEEIIALYEVR